MLAAQRVGGGRLIACTPLAYDSVTQVIGPAGGFLVAGGHVLVVDSLALSSPVSITAVAPSQSVNLVRFRPEGLKFKPGVHGIGALVATNLDNCNVHPNQVLQVVNVTDSLSILTYLQAPTTADSAVVVKYKTWGRYGSAGCCTTSRTTPWPGRYAGDTDHADVVNPSR